MKSLVEWQRADVVRHARRWIGTPYHHQACLVGQGVDCVGLVRGVWQELGGRQPIAVPAYGKDWNETTGHEGLLSAARQHLCEVDPVQAGPGDVLVFRYRARCVAKHAAILSVKSWDSDPAMRARLGAGIDGFTFIHAMEGVGVSEVPMTAWWRRRVAGAFRFRGVVE